MIDLCQVDHTYFENISSGFQNNFLLVTLLAYSIHIYLKLPVVCS